MVMVQQGAHPLKTANALSLETKQVPVLGHDDEEDAALLATAPWVRGYRWGDQGPEVQGEFPWILHGFSSLETIAGTAVDPVGDFILASVGWRQNRRWLRIDRFNGEGEGRGPAHPAAALSSR